jgi:hypothetical protein
VAFSFSQEHRHMTKKWIKNSNYICVLEAEKNDILSLIENVKYHNIQYSIFEEPDLGNEITAIAIAPGQMSKFLCSNFKLALK